MDYRYTVKITDKDHKYFGQELPGACVYYDIYHQGNGGPDLFFIRTPEGEQNILSTSIDTGHYWNQRRQEEIDRIGANVGDMVRIIRGGSGGCDAGFDWNAPHVITKIDSSGHVEWDHGAAFGFRPDVEVLHDSDLNSQNS